jgi:RHS repeat-associated protein
MDRMTKITDGPDSTEYAYDDTGQRTIERGPQSEYATVNPWVMIKSGNIMTKNIWAGDDRIATKYDEPDGSEEQKQYFLHKDLQGSTNVVTDRLGQVFQHHEYFATGETWVDESSTVFRTPYQYGGGYTDEVRDTINFGARWYDQGREMFYSPDPVLVEDPTAIVDKPELRTAYAYAGSNPVTNVDPTGYDYTDAIRKAYAADPVSFTHVLILNPALRASSMEALGDRMPKSVKYLVNNHERLTKRQELFEKIDGFNDIITPLHIEIGEDGKISKIKLFNFKSIYKRDSAAAATSSPASSGSSPAPSTASTQTGATDSSAAGLGSGPVASASSTGSSASSSASSSAPSATTDTPSAFTAANKPSSSSGGGGDLASHRRSSATTRAPTVAGSE